MEQRYALPGAGQSFAVSWQNWLALQNGVSPTAQCQYENTPRYLSTPRALSEFVHHDYTFQAYLSAALILSGYGPAALNDTNPYKSSKTQAGFVTFGGPQIIDCMARAANASLMPAWFHKWMVHRRIRPEELGGRVHSTMAGIRRYPLSEDLFKSPALNLVHWANGSWLLPQAYPEGCPAHPPYPAGHAVIAGACVTMLKAFFNEDFVIPHPVVADASGTALLPHEGKLTVGGELNKLASNIAMARDTAGVHWRSDSEQGIRLGEAVAIGLLRDRLGTFPEPFRGFTFTSFAGERVTVA